MKSVQTLWASKTSITFVLLIFLCSLPLSFSFQLVLCVQSDQSHDFEWAYHGQCQGICHENLPKTDGLRSLCHDFFLGSDFIHFDKKTVLHPAYAIGISWFCLYAENTTLMPCFGFCYRFLENFLKKVILII